MLSVGLGLSRQEVSSASWWLPAYAGAGRSADYANGRYMSQGVAVEGRASTAWVKDADGVLASASALELAIGAGRGLLIEQAATNKCENSNANPIDLAGITKSGDAAATLALVSDSMELAAAGLENIC